MCQAFAQRGYEVTLIAQLRHAKGAPCGQPTMLWDHYGITTPFNIIDMGTAQRGLNWKKLRSHLYSLRAVNVASKASPHLIFTRSPVAALVSLMQGWPTILELHALYGSILERLHFSLLRRMKSPKRLVVISRALRDDFTERYPRVFRDDEIIIAHDGVDLEQFSDSLDKQETRCELGLEQDRLIAGYSGHFYRGKGTEIVLKLAERCPDIRFLLVGGTSEDLAKVKTQVNERKLTNVRLEGFVAHHCIPKYLSACDVLLLPLQRRVEAHGGGFDISRWTSPMKLFEYMASGRPIIASDLPVLLEVLDESNCFICKADDIGHWESVLQQLRKGSTEGDQRARKASQDVVKYTWQARVERCLEGFPETGVR